LTIDRQIYRTRFGEEEMGGRIELWQVLCEHWFARYIPADSTTLDLGAGACEFINNIVSAKKYAIDHNPDVTGHAADSVECIVAELVDGLKQVPDDSIDRIMVSNVFEHLPDRQYLYDCLAEAHRVLRSGGKILVMQPNIRVVKERFYDYSDHSLPLTEKGMAESLQSNGFVLEEVRTRFLPYTTKSRYPRWPWLVKLYLMFPPAHYFMGGQMFLVGRKDGVVGR
jgi:ubiquinone/menaquinone biosynthesis C-methylase UbiE